jgi:hypothetical protein
LAEVVTDKQLLPVSLLAGLVTPLYSALLHRLEGAVVVAAILELLGLV